ncbi:MAG: phage integrase SAM-like domain-containing protein [Chitinophagaceae bacterium]
MKRISLLFFIRKSKKLLNGTVPIYIRITIAESRFEIATKRYIEPKKWNPAAQKVTGSSEEIKTTNAYLKSLEQEIYAAHQTLAHQGRMVTVEELKSELTGKRGNSKLVIEIFREHNERINALVGQEYAPGTLQRYQTSLKHTVNFLKWKYNVSDISITEINHEFIASYDFYLRSVCKCANNSAVK